MKINPKEIAVICDGGGLRGCYSVGFLGGFLDYFKQPKFEDNEFYFQGISVGSLNLGCLAQDLNIKTLEDIWEGQIQTGKVKVFNKRTAIRLLRKGKRNALFDNKDLLNLIKDNVDVRKIANSPVRLEVAVTNERNGNKLEFFSNQGLTVKEHPLFIKSVCASASLMSAFEPLEIKNGLYSDGLNFEVERAIDDGCKTIFVFYNNHIWLSPSMPPEQMSFQKRGRRMSNIAWSRWMQVYLELLLWRHPELEIVEHSCLPKSILDITRRVRQSQKKSIKLILLGPQINIPTLSIISFRNGDITKAIHHGRKVFEKVMKEV